MDTLRNMQTDATQSRIDEEVRTIEAKKERFLLKIADEVKALCDIVVADPTTKVISKELNGVMANIKVELFDHGIKQLVIPVQASFEKEEYALPEKEILARKISEIDSDTSFEQANLKKTHETSEAIIKHEQIKRENYWGKEVAKPEVVKEAMEFATQISLNKVSYPSSLKVGDQIPLSGAIYQIIAEDPGEWHLTRVIPIMK